MKHSEGGFLQISKRTNWQRFQEDGLEQLVEHIWFDSSLRIQTHPFLVRIDYLNQLHPQKRIIGGNPGFLGHIWILNLGHSWFHDCQFSLPHQLCLFGLQVLLSSMGPNSWCSQPIVSQETRKGTANQTKEAPQGIGRDVPGSPRGPLMGNPQNKALKKVGIHSFRWKHFFSQIYVHIVVMSTSNTNQPTQNQRNQHFSPP